MAYESFDLVGRCPVCGGISSSTDYPLIEGDGYGEGLYGDGPYGGLAITNNLSFKGLTIADNELEIPLVWSMYYRNYVCRLCFIEGQDLMIDPIRRNDENRKIRERQKMGYVNTYTCNETI